MSSHTRPAHLLFNLHFGDVLCSWVEHDDLEAHLIDRLADTTKFLKSLEISSVFSYNEIENINCGRAQWGWHPAVFR